MQKTTVYLPDDLKAALKRMAKSKRRSEADLIREALAAITEEATAPTPKLPLFKSSGSPIAERIDDELAKGFGVR